MMKRSGSSNTSSSRDSVTEPVGPQRNATEQVARKIQAAILGGTIGPGSPLREISLSKELGVSRNTVREALRILQADGLAHHQVNAGFVVAALDRNDVYDIYAGRQLIEVRAAQLAVDMPELLERLEEVVAKMEAAAGRRDFDTVLGSDRQFHEVLVSALGSKRIARFYNSLQDELVLALALADRQREDLAEMAENHRHLLRMLRTEPPLAAAAVATHLRDARCVIVGQVGSS